MSHILDALRRADEERHRGRSPDLGAIIQPVRRPAARPRAARGLAPALSVALAVALALVALLLVIVIIWRGGLTPARSPAPAQDHAPAEVVATASAADTAAPSADPLVPRARIAEAQRLRSFDDVLPPPPPPPPAPTVTRSDRAATITPVTTTTAPVPGAGSGIGSGSEGGPAGTASGPPWLADLPASLRADFPAITIDVHVYNRDPARRFVLIGAQRYGEGDTLAEGPLLERIDTDSLRLQWRGQRLRLPVR